MYFFGLINIEVMSFQCKYRKLFFVLYTVPEFTVKAETRTFSKERNLPPLSDHPVSSVWNREIEVTCIHTHTIQTHLGPPRRKYWSV